MCAKIIMYCKYEVRLYIKYVKYLKNIFIENIFIENESFMNVE